MEWVCTVPDGRCGDWAVETFTVSKRDSELSILRAMASQNYKEAILEGTYKRLIHGETVVMSSTQMEYDTNRVFIKKAHGNILIVDCHVICT